MFLISTIITSILRLDEHKTFTKKKKKGDIFHLWIGNILILPFKKKGKREYHWIPKRVSKLFFPFISQAKSFVRVFIFFFIKLFYY